jgi:hypothetical protein
MLECCCSETAEWLRERRALQLSVNYCSHDNVHGTKRIRVAVPVEFDQRSQVSFFKR